MSKAFTRESDDLPEQPLARPAIAVGKDYLTPAGAERLRDELVRLNKEFPDTETQPSRLRIAQIQQILTTAEIVPVPPQPWEQVLFGATVTVRDTAGSQIRYRIVGREETDADRDWVSWTSPIARALLKAKLGQQVRFRIPAGEQVWEIVRIEYE